MLQKSGRLVLWEAMFILELHSAETQAQITVVDGNWSDKVSRHTYNLTDSSLIGFASPIY